MDELEELKSSLEELNGSSSFDTSSLDNSIAKNWVAINVLGRNNQKIIENLELDEFDYTDYKFEQRLQYADDFQSVMELYAYDLDGAFAEGFRFNLHTSSTIWS